MGDHGAAVVRIGGGVMTGQQSGHPEWCSQGEFCERPRKYPDATVEWSHWAVTYIEGGRHGGRVSLYRVENLAPDGVTHSVQQGVDVEVEGTMTEDQVDEFVTVLQQAVRTARRGLDGTPGGLPAVIAAAKGRQ